MKRLSRTFVIIGATFLSYSIFFWDLKLSHSQSVEHFQKPELSFVKAKEILFMRFHGKKLDEEMLFQSATQGMLSSLNDGTHHWNKLITPNELKEMTRDNASEFAGIGVQISFNSESGLVHVLGIISGSPAEKNGVQAEDQIISVNGRTYRGKALIDVLRDIRGNLGDTIHLNLLRGDQVISKSFKLEKLSWSSVEWEILPDKVGHLSISSFGQNTSDLIKNALKEFQDKKIRSLVIDLRDNDGGDFLSAVHSAELFLPKGAVITRVVTRDQPKEEKTAAQDSILPKLYIGILSNQTTAAGAELFASALIENLNATLIGEKTAGKWNVQAIDTLPNGFAIKYTAQSFRSPHDQTYQDLGLKPDIEVATRPGLPPYRQVFKNLEERLDADSQLRAALFLLRAEMKK